MERGSLMLNTTTFVGLDVHARSIKAVALDAMTGEVRSATFGYDAAAVADWIRSDDAREDLKRCKQRLSKFLLRHGYAFSETTPTGRRKGNWTAAHWAWIRSIEFPEKADDDVLAYYIDATRQAMEDKKRLEKLVEAEASKPRWKKRVDSLRCLKGVDAMTAAGIVFEAGEFSRFKNARSFAAWLGLTPSEHSSGESVRQGGITKAGNKHLRKRREEMPGRGVHKNKANVATARELACWCWAVGRMVENG